MSFVKVWKRFPVHGSTINISTLVGSLYEEGDIKRDGGFTIFYMGINIGAFVCNFVAAYMRINYGWGAAFAAAGV